MIITCFFVCPFVQGYDISFLITNFHTEQMFKHKLVDFVIQVPPPQHKHTHTHHTILSCFVANFERP